MNKKQPITARLLRHIKKADTGCWLWTGVIHPRHGYGQIRVDGVIRRVHRVAFAVFTGTEPGEKLVCHRCDIRNCINPEHLFLGSVRDNSRDMMAKGRGKGQFKRKYTETDIERFRMLKRLSFSSVKISEITGASAPTVRRATRGAE